MFAEIEHAQLPKASKHWRDWEKYVGEETLPIEFEAFSSHKLYVDTLVKSGDIEKNPGWFFLSNYYSLYVMQTLFQGNNG